MIVVWMILRGQALPLRDYFLQRLPAVGSGRVHAGRHRRHRGDHRRWSIAPVPTQWQDAFVTTFAMGIVLLSVVVITGYAGQLSLGQFALAGFGALVAGRLVDAGGWPFAPALARRRRRHRAARRAVRAPRRAGRAASTSPSSRSASARPSS